MKTLEWQLASTTEPGWAQVATADPVELLCDHAHCELGAASTAQGLIARHTGDRMLVDRLSSLAIEELRHFRQVVALLRRMGGELRPRGENYYVTGFRTCAAPTRRSNLLDRLLVAALIEARSHERFEVLSKPAPQAELRELYDSLLVSEEAHGRLFVDLALRRFDAAEVEQRLTELITLEAGALASLPPGSLVHSGPPAS